MNEVQKIADAVLYEGYMLYPYRASNVKNRQRWTFGGLYPKAFTDVHGDSSSIRVEVPVISRSTPSVQVTVRFLHLLSEERGGRTWQLATERDVPIDELKPGGSCRQPFVFPASDHLEEGAVQHQLQVDGLIEMHLDELEPSLFKLSTRVSNITVLPHAEDVSREEASLNAMVSTHVILHVDDGEFLSLTDPPPQWSHMRSVCENQGVWPVLAGQEGSHDWMLASPIILYDYPQVAPESSGDLFDGAEIDEILTLRILTMTDQEKEEMRALDPRTRQILERTEALSTDDLMKLHGRLHNPRGVTV